MTAVETVATLFEQGALDKVGPAFQALVASDPTTPDDCAYQVYLALHERGKIEPAARFLVTYANAGAAPNEKILQFADRIYADHDQEVAVNLYGLHLSNGGASIAALDACVFYGATKGMHAFVGALYRQVQDRIPLHALSNETLMNLALAMLNSDGERDAANMYLTILQRDPSNTGAKHNLLGLARAHQFPEAVAYYRAEMNRIARRTSGATPPVSDQRPYELAGDASWEEISEAVRGNGFCIVRGGCEVTRLAFYATRVREMIAKNFIFPMAYNEVFGEGASGLFRFDASALMDRLLEKQSHTDYDSSMVRHVNPAVGASFTPFHQDSVAFQKPLANIWVPLTPAGGDYPSIQFVRKRIDVAEQTRIFEGDYNLVEIEEAFVTEKYGDAIVEVGDAQPGDCVVFFGTTIHRSHNLAKATQPRINLELRWS